jgi:FMN reductase
VTQARPLVVGIGGTTVSPSSTERALEIALRASEARGAEVRMFGGAFLARLPLYVPRSSERTSEESEFIAAVRRADGIVIASPGYHGSISGLVKNALDLLEETAADPRVYLSDLPVGLIATAYGAQATVGTIAALRSIVHALRGWPTPLAAAVNSAVSRFSDDGACSDPAVRAQLALVGEQVVDFLKRPALA